MTRAFVIRPFGKKKDNKGNEFDFEEIHRNLIEPALLATGFSGSTTGEIVESGSIHEDMFSLILEADFVICDVSIHNANVFYELGVRHALRKKRTILIRETSSTDDTPFDILTYRYLRYDQNDLKDLASDKQKQLQQRKLIDVINESKRGTQETDSPIFKMLPKLPEANPQSIQVLPLDFQEEVARAKAAKSKGWLRLLAQDVESLRIQWLGLEHIAEMQWNLKDYEAAKDNFEMIRKSYEDSVFVNLALANIYERLYKINKKPDVLVVSNRRIDRALENPKATPQERVEALSLKGRNLKTLWRETFEDLDSLEERRKIAMNEKKLRDSYEAYKDAFNRDLNHFWSGLGALQMGTIFLNLSEAGDSWKDIFDDDETADDFRKQLVEDIKLMQTVVSFSVKLALSQMRKGSQERLWGEISRADIQFLKEQREDKVVTSYINVIPQDNPFAWDAVKRQLELFACLNIRGELANKVINEVEKRQKFTESQIDTHLILFVGHRVDMPDRADPRFPSPKAEEAKELIRNAIKELGETHQIIGLASASPGADILFHEVCLELEIPTKICLPMPSALYAGLTFDNLDSWQGRYFNLKDKLEILELSDQEGLPRWLEKKKDTDPWERGNRWVLQMGLTSDADKVTLIALWDGNKKSIAPGGSAHMVNITRKSGQIRVIDIDSKQLLD